MEFQGPTTFSNPIGSTEEPLRVNSNRLSPGFTTMIVGAKGGIGQLFVDVPNEGTDKVPYFSFGRQEGAAAVTKIECDQLGNLSSYGFLASFDAIFAAPAGSPGGQGAGIFPNGDIISLHGNLIIAIGAVVVGGRVAINNAGQCLYA